jgi:hypothetical protein
MLDPKVYAKTSIKPQRAAAMWKPDTAAVGQEPTSLVQKSLPESGLSWSQPKRVDLLVTLGS